MCYVRVLTISINVFVHITLICRDNIVNKNRLDLESSPSFEAA